MSRYMRGTKKVQVKDRNHATKSWDDFDYPGSPFPVIGFPTVMDDPLVDTGLLDSDGNTIMKGPHRIGFIWTQPDERDMIFTDDYRDLESDLAPEEDLCPKCEGQLLIQRSNEPTVFDLCDCVVGNATTVTIPDEKEPSTSE